MKQPHASDDFGPALPLILCRPDGDVDVAWLQHGQVRVRRFRAHLGHVVEVVGSDGRLRRIGAGLNPTGSLRIDAALDAVIRRAVAGPPPRAGVLTQATEAPLGRLPAQAASGVGAPTASSTAGARLRGLAAFLSPRAQ